MRRHGVTLVEALVALAILAVLFVAWWSVLGMMRRGEAKVSDRIAALASAEVALSRIGMDVASMLPPDPFQPARCPRVGGDGKSFEFYRTVRERGGWVARRVRWSVRDAEGGRLQLVCDGRTVPGVALSAFDAQLVAGPHGEPRLRVALTGVAGAETHPVDVQLALPPAGPISAVGLPAAALVLVEKTMKIVE